MADSSHPTYETLPEPLASHSSFAPSISLGPPIDVDAWELELDSLNVEHLLTTSISGRRSEWKPQDSMHDMAADWHLGGLLTSRVNTKHEPKPEVNTAKPRASFLGWSLMLCGIMAFACGAVLMGMSLAQARSELWRMGLPLALVGQCGLVVGLALQLEKVWQNHRRANDRLQEVDEHVSDLKLTTDLLSTTHSGPSQAFYHHMAGGANTELLLADLKGQMDMLAAQVVRSSR